jgi:hypothetical protein
MRADDIDPARATSLGASYLKEFLGFAERGVLSLPRVDTWALLMQSPFEQAVHDELTNCGLQLVPHVGRAGYKIDFGVLDYDLPGRFLAGIECDGATYHSAATARDRDRLRQEVLEELGWKLIRIWSTDWYNNKETQIKRVLDFVAEQKKLLEQERLAFPPGIKSTIDRNEEHAPDDTQSVAENDMLAPVRLESGTEGSVQATANRRPLEPYALTPIRVLGDVGVLNTTDDQTVIDIIKSVIDQEAPIHTAELKRRTAAHWQISRVGTRIGARLDDLLRSIIENEEAILREEFVWKTGQTHIAPRNRNIEGLTFSGDSVPPEELDELILYVLEDREARNKEQLTNAVAKALGFGRAGQTLAERIQSRIQLLLDQSALEPCSSGVRLATASQEAYPYSPPLSTPSVETTPPAVS